MYLTIDESIKDDHENERYPIEIRKNIRAPKLYEKK